MRHSALFAGARAFLIEVFDAPIRGAVAALWFVGAAFATSAAALAFATPPGPHELQSVRGHRVQDSVPRAELHVSQIEREVAVAAGLNALPLAVVAEQER
jgi:hypothetical protein